MESWSTHDLYQQIERTQGSEAAARAKLYAENLIAKDVAVVFSLGHLSKITEVSYRVLHDSVNRKREAANYRMYAVAKRSGGRRFIHSVCSDLFRVQQFINQEILQKCTPHVASFAFHSGGGIRKCAMKHCGARWLFQYDLKDFFFNITEIDVYKIFSDLGYQNLLSFEFAKLCTTTRLPDKLNGFLIRRAKRQQISQNFCIQNSNDDSMPYHDWRDLIGVLPQGAATSPMLSNLVAKSLDESLYQYATQNGFVYTRYADDLTFSASAISSKRAIGKINWEIINRIKSEDFKENKKKTRIAGPGSKKIVLGLLIDGSEPRLSKSMYKRIDRHLYASLKFGLQETASHEGFESAYGFYNHLSGLIAFVKDVDFTRWKIFYQQFLQIETPWAGSEINSY